MLSGYALGDRKGLIYDMLFKVLKFYLLLIFFSSSIYAEVNRDNLISIARKLNSLFEIIENFPAPISQGILESVVDMLYYSLGAKCLAVVEKGWMYVVPAGCKVDLRLMASVKRGHIYFQNKNGVMVWAVPMRNGGMFWVKLRNNTGETGNLGKALTYSVIGIGLVVLLGVVVALWAFSLLHKRNATFSRVVPENRDVDNNEIIVRVWHELSGIPLPPEAEERIKILAGFYRPLKVTKFSVKEIVLECIMRQSEKFDNVEFAIEGDDFEVESDSLRLEIILDNLLKNAARESRSVVVELNSDEKRIFVKNAVDCLKVDFSRYKGTGIGLKLVREMCFKLGVKFDIECKDGFVIATLSFENK